MPYPPVPSMYNPFLVSEPQYIAQQQNKYPQMTGNVQAQLSDANMINRGIDINQQPDPYYSMANTGMPIRTRESNQQTLLRDRIQPLLNFNVQNTRDVTSPGGNLPYQQPVETPYLDQITGKAENPYFPNYIPFSSPDEMHKAEMNITSEDEDIAAKELPAFYGEYEKAREQAKKEYWQNNKPIEMPFTPFKGPIPNVTGIENLAKDIPLPLGNTFSNNAQEETLKQTPNNKFGTPEAYYLGKSMLDASALINNMVQPQPPSIQMKNTYFERQKLNPEPYDTMRSEMRNQGTQAYRLQRENISQASDLMKGLAAVTSGTQQGLMQVGMQQAAAEQQVQNINQQISAQEQAGITQTQNQETMTNYQIQAQAQQQKDQMVSAQLQRLGDTAGAYSDYVVKKELTQKMTEMSKDQADKGNAIQIAMIKYQASQNELGSDTYKEAQRQSVNQYINETKTNMLNDPRYSTLGANYDPLTFDQRENKYKTLEQRLGILSDSHDGFSEDSKPIAPTRTADMDDTKWNTIENDYKKRQYGWESDKAAYDKYKLELDKNKPVIELERKFLTELKNAYDISGKRQDFQSDWFKKRGLKTYAETIEEVESLVNPNRQIFK